MLAALHTMFHSQAFHGAMLGLGIAARVDFKNFIKWKSFSDAKTYNWNVALFNWLEGFVYGLLGGLGLQSWLS